MPVKNVGDIFTHLFWMTILLGMLVFSGQVVNASELLPNPIQLDLVQSSFTLLFGALIAIMDPTMIIKRLSGNESNKEN